MVDTRDIATKNPIIVIVILLFFYKSSLHQVITACPAHDRMEKSSVVDACTPDNASIHSHRRLLHLVSSKSIKTNSPMYAGILLWLIPNRCSNSIGRQIKLWVSCERLICHNSYVLCQAVEEVPQRDSALRPFT